MKSLDVCADDWVELLLPRLDDIEKVSLHDWVGTRVRYCYTLSSSHHHHRPCFLSLHHHRVYSTTGRTHPMAEASPSRTFLRVVPEVPTGEEALRPPRPRRRMVLPRRRRCSSHRNSKNLFHTFRRPLLQALIQQHQWPRRRRIISVK